VVQLNIKFASLKKKSLFYGDNFDDTPIEYHDVKVGQGIPEELVEAMQGLVTRAEQAGISLDGVQSLRQLVTECKDIFRIKCSAARTNVVFTNSYVDNNTNLISE
jgi:hypothetical protein